MKKLVRTAHALWCSRGGNFASAFAIVFAVLMGLAGGVVDFAAYNNHRSSLQSVADGAALAAAREASLNSWNEEVAKASVSAHVEANLEQTSKIGNLYKAFTKVDRNARSVTVRIEQDHYPYFTSSLFPSPQIAVEAMASSSKTQNVCIIGLMKPQTKAKSSIHLDDRSHLDADDCAVFSNSDHRFGLRVDRDAQLYSGLTCSAGGVMSSKKSVIEPQITTDCPPVTDPLEKRPMPNVGPCDFRKLSVATHGDLRPGVYCDGLSIGGGANVTLKPGIYVVKDGPLVVGEGATLTGVGVSIVLTGDRSIFKFERESTIDLTAPETGEMAGLLIFEDNGVSHSFDFDPIFMTFKPGVRLHKISSNSARNLLGTIYLPRSILMIDSEAKVADASAYTAIVVARLWLKDGPTLTLNTNYAATKVPVPDGLGPAGGMPRLAR